MAQPIPGLIDLDIDHNLTLDDLGPLSHYWMLVKFIVIYPGVELENFEVGQCRIGEDARVYIVKDGKWVVQFSPKDAEVWNFLFHYTDQVYFKTFEDAKPQEKMGESHIFGRHIGGYLAIKITNRNIVEKIQEACYKAPYFQGS